MTALNFKWKHEKLAVRLIVRVRGHFALCCFAEDGYVMHKGLLNTLVQPLFCSLNLLFGGAHSRRGLLQTPFTLRRRNLKTHSALFLRLGLWSRVIRHGNGAFRKRFSNRRNLKTPALSFRVDRKHFSKTDLFEHDRIRRATWIPWLRFPQTKI